MSTSPTDLQIEKPTLTNLTIISMNAGGGNPYLNFSGSPFNGFNLKGMYVILNTGFSQLLWVPGDIVQAETLLERGTVRT